MITRTTFRVALLVGGWLAAPALAPSAVRAEPAPAWLRVERHRVLDGRTDDLVTGGLGVEGLISGPPPGYADPLRPTAEELRRAALFRRGDPGFGFGRLWGPNVDAATGAALPDGGRIAGEEWLAYADDAEGRPAAAMLL
jgi:hydroxybutyrate-dimer hydrolase